MDDPGAHAASTDHQYGSTAAGSGTLFHDRRTFWWKTVVLAVVTLALIPILLWQHALAATLYVIILVVIHAVGLVVFAYGVRRHQIAPTRRGLVTRVLGLVVAGGLLVLASQGLHDGAVSWVFWGSLFAIWFVHTAALAMLHIMGPRERAACPFV